MKKSIFYLFILLVGYNSASGQVSAAPEPIKERATNQQNAAYWDNQIYVVFENNVPIFWNKNDLFLEASTIPELANIIEEYNIKQVRNSYHFYDHEILSRTLRVYFDETNKIDQLLEKLNNDPRIYLAEKIPIDRKTFVPNDNSYNSQWHLQKINAELAWDLEKGSNTINVAVVDDAVEVNHPDLVGNIQSGWDAAHWDNDPSPPSNNSNFDHGTHVAGIVAASTNNTIGVASLGYYINIIPVKVTFDWLPDAFVMGPVGIVWASANGADIINCSWGSRYYSFVNSIAVAVAISNGCIVVAAAGNDNNTQKHYPAAYSNVISVASSTSNDSKSSFSTYGSWVDVTAPGSSIYSTTINSSYGNKSGTSMASPMVASLMGLVWSAKPNASRQQVINAVLNSAAPLSWSGGGSGRIDAFAAVQAIIGTVPNNVNTVSTFPFSSSFETGLDLWVQSNDDDIDWTRRTGSTPSSSTGPTSASDGNYYMYIEASGSSYPSKTAHLYSPIYDIGNIITPYISFDYHMYGNTMGTLKLEISTDNGTTWSSIWSRSGNKGNQWSLATIPLSTYAMFSSIRFRFKGTTGSGYRSDMAIDDVKVYSLACGNVTNTTLPFYEGFEYTSRTHVGVGLDNVICTPTYKWDFSSNSSGGRLRMGDNAIGINTGNGAATLDRSSTGSYAQNYIYLTLDLSNYATSNTLDLSFDFKDHNDEAHINDRVRIRGSNSDSWLEIYDWSTINSNNFKSVVGLDIDALLAANGQIPTSTFQIIFGQYDNASATSDGFSLDNVLITNDGPSCTDSFEPNDNFNWAVHINNLTTNLYDSTSCLSVGDEDWYSFMYNSDTFYFSVSGATTSDTGDYGLSFDIWLLSSLVSIETFPVNGSTTDTYITLYDKNYNSILKSDDNGGIGNFSQLSYSFNCSGQNQADLGLHISTNIEANYIQNTGTQISGSLKLVNGGNVNTGAFTTSFYLSSDNNITTSDYKILDYQVPNVDSNGYYVVNFSTDISTVSPPIPNGTYYFGSIIDSNNDVLECDENNNRYWINSQVTVTSPSSSCIPLAINTFYTSGISQTQTTFNCSSTAGITSYDWQYRIQGNSTWQNVSPTSVPSIIINGLVAGTTYEYRINIRCAVTNTWSGWSASNIFTTTANATNPFSFTPTNSSGVFLGQAQISGIPASANDWIAAFDQSGNCAGASLVTMNSGIAYINLSIYGDDPTTTNVDEGMNAGEYFTLQLYDASEGIYRDYPISSNQFQFTQWSSPGSIPAYDNPNTIYNFITTLADTIDLNAGWNLISTDLIPSDSSITAVFSDLITTNSLEYVTGYNLGATSFDPNGLPFLNTLTHINQRFGYWVKVNVATRLIVHGSPIPHPPKPNLNAGWNLIGYVPQASFTPDVYFKNLIDSSNLEYVTGYNLGATSFDPNGLPFLNTLTQLENSFGYWVKVNTAANGSTYRGNGFLPTSVYDFFNGTSNLSNYSGEQVIILTDEGEICGYLDILSGGYLMTTPVYGDDNLTSIEEGIDIGEKLLFKFKEQVLDESIIFQGDMRTHHLDLNFNLDLFTKVNDIETLSSSIQCYPNPFTTSLLIKYELEENVKITVKIYNQLMQLVEVIEKGKQASGEHQLEWSAEQANTGMYLITLEINGQVARTQKVILQR